MFNEFKLFEMSKDELSMLCLITLKAIFEEFDLQVSGRRKALYVDCVVSFVNSCSVYLSRYYLGCETKFEFYYEMIVNISCLVAGSSLK